MSTEGAGKCCAVAGSPLMAVMRVGLGGADVVIAGVEHIIMELDKYENEHSNAYRKYLESLSRGTLVNSWGVPEGGSGRIDQQTMSEAERQEIQRIARRALMELTRTETDARSNARIERENAARRLSYEIGVARSLLPPTLLEEAEQALNGSIDVIAEAADKVRTARQMAEAALTLQERRRRAIREELSRITMQMMVSMQMLQEARSEQLAPFVERRKEIEALVAKAESWLDDRLDAAEAAADEAQQGAQALVESVSTHVSEAWDRIASQANGLLGTLKAMRRIAADAMRANMVERRTLLGLTEHMAQVYNEVESMLEQPSLAVQRRLTQLTEQTEMLKQDMLGIVETYQQRKIAETIAGTLQELGFHAVAGSQQVVYENGDVTRVVVSTAPDKTRTPQTVRDDRVVSFDVSRNGEIAYDFSGYIGDACVKEAERVFAALRAKGLYILESQTAEQLQAAIAQGRTVTPEMLDQPEFQPHVVKNKTQAELAERLLGVLERMQYATIRQQVVGGCIELEAFNGPIGYRVVLPPDGSLQVYKDDEVKEVDVTSEKDDPVAAEAQQVQNQQERTKTARRKQRSSAFYREQQTLQEQ